MSALDHLVCHQIDHIEVFASDVPVKKKGKDGKDEPTSDPQYEVEIHCTCRKYRKLKKQQWEKLVKDLHVAED